MSDSEYLYNLITYDELMDIEFNDVFYGDYGKYSFSISISQDTISIRAKHRFNKKSYYCSINNNDINGINCKNKDNINIKLYYKMILMGLNEVNKDELQLKIITRQDELKLSITYNYQGILRKGESKNYEIILTDEKISDIERYSQINEDISNNLEKNSCLNIFDIIRNFINTSENEKNKDD